MSDGQSTSNERLIEYLFGRLPEDEAARLDEASVADDAMAARLAALEHELFDAYAAGELSPIDRAHFEAVFLVSAESHRRLDVARALRNRANAVDAREPQRFGNAAWWIAAAATVVLAVGAWIVLKRGPQPSPGPDNVVVTNPPQPPTPTKNPGAVVAFALLPGQSRSASDASTLVVKPEVETILLKLAGDPGSAPLSDPQVTIRTVEGQEVFRGKARPVTPSNDQTLAELEVPATILTANDYIVQLSELRRGTKESRARYFLRVRAGR